MSVGREGGEGVMNGRWRLVRGREDIGTRPRW